MQSRHIRNGGFDADELLAGAAKMIASVPYFWLVTAGDGVHARPMGCLPPEAGEDALTVRFLTDDRSRKTSEIRRDGAVTAIFENLSNDAYVAVTGRATLHEDRGEVRRRWKRRYDVYFPSEDDRAHAIFVEIAIERLELWIRGVTPEPFGMKTTLVERDGDGWRAG